ncbi:MAG: DUF4340 domain-containing protein [Treponema sp.]|nr:DUF4340 domain-containing protein [Treponema sp.]
MLYRVKAGFLSGLALLLALVYALTFILDPNPLSDRNAPYVWLKPEFRDQADRIEITGRAGEEPAVLLRRGEKWFVSREDGEYPARQTRVEEFLRLLSASFHYPVRGNSPASYERLSLTEETASRILIRGGVSIYPLLDLLIGRGDSTGSEVYLRKNNQNEIRSGEDRLSPYLRAPRNSWYMLKLFPDHLRNPDMVQRLTLVSPPSPGENPPSPAPPLVLSRNGDTGGWDLDARPLPDKQLVEAYIRALLDAEGEDFIQVKNREDPPLNDGRIVLELEDGSVLTMRVGYTAYDSRLCASVSGTSLVYALADWTVNRIFRGFDYFEKQ